MKATPLISSTLASAVVFLLMKLAVIAIANFPLNSFLLKPENQMKNELDKWGGDKGRWSSQVNQYSACLLKPKEI